MELIIHDGGDGAFMASVGPVLICCFTGTVTAPVLKRVGAVQDVLMERYPKYGVLVLVDPSTGTLDAAAQKEARDRTKRFGDRQFGVAIVINGSTAFQIFMKSIVAAVQVATRPPSPWRVFSDDDLAPAVAWLAEEGKRCGVACDATAVADAIPVVLARRIEKESAPRAQTTDPAAGFAGGPRSSTLPRQLGRYTLTSSLGAGGMAQTFRATHKGPGGFEKALVVKTIQQHFASRPEMREMFLREARLAARLPSHPNVVQVFDTGDVDGELFIAMELVDGLTVHQLATRAWLHGKQVPVDVAAAIVADAARGLHHAHTNASENGGPLIHRDISPDNLIVARDGTTKLLDFGIAKASDEEERTSSVLKGKLPYMAPEQVEGRPLDGRADLYALGCTLFWMLARRRPFERGASDLVLMKQIVEQEPPRLRTLAPDVPESIASIVSTLLEKDPSRRFATGQKLAAALENGVPPPAGRDAMAAFVDDVRRLGDGPTQPLQGTAATGQQPQRARLRSSVVIAAVAAVATLVFMLVALLWSRAP